MTKLRCLLVAVATLLPALQPRCQNDRPSVGELAPDLGLTAVLGREGDVPLTWTELRGKVVVVEFWATWCGACTQHLPEANRLAEEFADRDVQFLAVTSEDQARVERFLARFPRVGWVGLDGNEQAFGAYDPVSVPHVVIVDREGRIAASTWADRVTADVIERALAGEPLELPVKETKRTMDTQALANVEPPAGPEIRVEPYEGEPSRGMLRRDWAVHIGGASRDLILRMIYDYPKAQYRVELPEDEGLWRVHAAVPEDRADELHGLLDKTLRQRLGFDIVEEEAEIEIVVLERTSGAVPLAPSSSDKGSVTMRGGFLQARAKPMSVLATHLRRISGDRPCVDETGLDGLYDFEIDAIDRDSLVAALAELGLQYRLETRTMPVYVFRPATTGS